MQHDKVIELTVLVLASWPPTHMLLDTSMAAYRSKSDRFRQVFSNEKSPEFPPAQNETPHPRARTVLLKGIFYGKVVNV